VNDKDAAHTEMVADPSVEASEHCGACHATTTANYGTSLHKSFNGYKTLFETRSGITFDSHPELEEEFKNECGKCHVTCGQCHVSRPISVKGGLVQGHKFLATPSQSDNCTACHGSRVGEEYTGSREGYRADVHYIPNTMTCNDCHSGAEMHGNGTVYGTRYQTPAMPRCEDCHGDAAEANTFHSQHWGQLSCQVCHAQDYKSCNKCHVGGAGIAEPSYITFKIGRNPIPGEREYDYVTLRHVPIATDTYSEWGVGDLANYEALPTWKYASPHNIQRWTDRTSVDDGNGDPVASCDACHNTADEGGFFLRQADLDTMSVREADANRAMIVPDGPPTTW